MALTGQHVEMDDGEPVRAEVVVVSPVRDVLRSFWPRPRIRRPADSARLVLSAVAVVALVSLAIADPALLATAARLVPGGLTGLPRTLLSVLNVITSLAVLGVLLVLIVDALRSRRFAMTSAVLACALGILAGVGVAIAAGRLEDAAVRLLLGPAHESAAVPIIATVALVVGADVQWRRLRNAARLVVAAAVVCALALGSVAVPSAAYALLVGLMAGLAVRVASGVVPARPAGEVIRAVLARAGWRLGSLRLLEDAAGRARYAGIGSGEDDLRVTVVDPDRRGVPFGRRVWRVLLLRRSAVGRPRLSLRGELERQALSAALAESAGVAAPRVLALLAAGPSLVLVERPLRGTPFSDEPSSEAMASVNAAMRALRQLHDGGLAHGALTADGILLQPDGCAGFANLSSAQPAATDLQQELDVVALLVAAGQHIGADDVVIALRADYGSSPAKEARLAALLQPVALPWPVRRAVRGTAVLDEVRRALIGSGTRTLVTAVRLERLRPRTVITIAGATLAAHILATQLSSVGIGRALAHALPGWLMVALLGSAVTYLGSALALQAFVTTKLPLLRTTLVQVASSFLALVTPPAVGHVGLNIRYLQRAGVPTATATGTVAVKETATVIVTVPLLLICGWLSGVSASRLALLPSGTVVIVLAIAAGVLGLVAVVAPARRLLLRRLEPLVRRSLPQLLAAAGDPRRLATAVVGILLLNVGYVLALDASLRAFSVSLAVPTLVVVYLAASTIGSTVPTPGGLGAVEAALVGGLSASGVPVAEALTAVLAFRTATFWLPAPVGWVVFVGLQRRRRI